VHDIGEGHARFASAPEAPHVYKKDGFYYLLVAEGGTFETHAVTISRSKTLTGPYEQYQGNPILTHRHLGPGMDIHSTGHADLVDTGSGDWWMVALGMRGNASSGAVRGRETFLVPVSWPTGGWPVVNPGVGRIRAVEMSPKLPAFDPPSLPATDQFDGDKLAFAWNFLRTPRGPFWSLRQRPGFLRLSLKKETITEDANPAFIGRRIQHADFTVRTKLDFATKASGDFAGLALRNGKSVIRFGRARAPAPASGDVVMVAGGSTVDATPLRGPGSLYLKIECRRETECRFFHALTPDSWQELPTRTDTRALGHKAAGAQFTGAYVGLYATAAGQVSRNSADFDWFEYRAE
jgi:alpha-N-arabinofuranosidase